MVKPDLTLGDLIRMFNEANPIPFDQYMAYAWPDAVREGIDPETKITPLVRQFTANASIIPGQLVQPSRGVSGWLQDENQRPFVEPKTETNLPVGIALYAADKGQEVPTMINGVLQEDEDDSQY